MSKYKLNFGCGSNILQGWENYDAELDITKPLPFPDNSIDFIFNEHVLEHITQREGYSFFKECKRILKSGGVVRTATPSLTKVAYNENDEYRNFIRSMKWGDGKPGCGIETILFQHEHKCVYTADGLIAILYSLGFQAKEVELYQSEFPDLVNVEGHYRVIGRSLNDMETFCVEAIKP